MSRAATKSRAGRTPSARVAPPPPSQSPDVVDVIPGRLSQASWVSMLGQEEGEQVVADVLDEFLGQVMDRCYEVHLQNQLLPFTVSWARDALVHILEWQFMVQDEGEGPESAPTWSEDAEPLPSPTDPWAQGCVSVLRERPTTPLLPQQRIPVGQAAGRTDQEANQSSHFSGHANTFPTATEKLREPPGLKGHKFSPVPPPTGRRNASPKPPAEDRNLRKPLRFRAYKLPPARGASPNSEERRRIQLNSIPTSPTQDHTLSPMSSLILSVDADREEAEEESGAHSSIHRTNPLNQRNVFPVVPRLDPVRLPLHCVWPQYEVLDATPPKLHASGARARDGVPAGQKRDRLHSTQTEAQGTLISHGALSKGSRRSSLSGEVCSSFRKIQVPDRGSRDGVFPFSGPLMLDSMELVPGVSLEGPTGCRSGPLKGRPAQPEYSTELRPIRSSLPLPMFPHLAAGPAPRVIPLL